MNILVDIDGVVADTHAALLTLYNKDYDDDLRVEDITSWEMHHFVWPECGRKIYSYASHPDLYKMTMPMRGALQSVSLFRSWGHRVVFVTAGMFPMKIQWLYENGFLSGIDWEYDPDIVVAADKGLVHGEILIDDRPENLLIGDILFDRPWNQESMRNFRAYSWLDVVEAIRGCRV